MTKCSIADNGQIVRTKYHILRRNDDRTAILWCKDVVSCQHQYTSLSLCLSGKWQMDSHLVTIEVGVICSTCQRMKLKSTTLSQNWLECLNT